MLSTQRFSLLALAVATLACRGNVTAPPMPPAGLPLAGMTTVLFSNPYYTTNYTMSLYDSVSHVLVVATAPIIANSTLCQRLDPAQFPSGVVEAIGLSGDVGAVPFIQGSLHIAAGQGWWWGVNQISIPTTQCG